MENLSFIVPLDLTQRPLDILRKAHRIAKEAEFSNVVVIFGHNDRGTIFDKLLTLILSKFTSTSIISEKAYTGEVNASLLRNIAFSKVKTEFLVLLDVDIWPDFPLIEKYRQKVSANQKPFYMLPCLYLTQKGSNDLVKSKISAIELKNRFFSFSRKEFLHLASPSSVTVMRSADYESIGGFDNEFSGHGYEDFDFMMRLAIFHNQLPDAPDLLLDKVARSPLFSVGFRRYLGEQCLDLLIEKDIVFHLYHDKQKTNYSIARKRNYELFKKRHKHCAGGISNDDATLITSFVKLCIKKELDINKFAILFDNKPGHIDRLDSFRRRLRFLLND